MTNRVAADTVAMNNLETGSLIDYSAMRQRLDTVRGRLCRPLTYTEKLLYSHLDDPHQQQLERGQSYLRLRPDRVASHDATAQTVLLQLLGANIAQPACPMVVYSDHLIVAETNGIEDLGTAWKENREVWDFLKSACAKFNVGLWKPGSGIFHQVLLENYAYPGGLLIGTDSHTPNAGGLGMCAIGVGGGDVVDVLAGLAWEVKAPRIIGVRLSGTLRGWASPKGWPCDLTEVQASHAGADMLGRHHSEIGRDSHRQRWERNSNRVFWPGSRKSILHGHGNHLQHGCGDWSNNILFSLH